MTQVSPRSSLIPPIKNEKRSKNTRDHVTSDNETSNHVTSQHVTSHHVTKATDEAGSHLALSVREEEHPVQITWNSDDSLDHVTYHAPARDHSTSTRGNHVTRAHVTNHVTRGQRNTLLMDELALLNQQSPHIAPLHQGVN